MCWSSLSSSFSPLSFGRYSGQNCKGRLVWLAWEANLQLGVHSQNFPEACKPRLLPNIWWFCAKICQVSLWAAGSQGVVHLLLPAEHAVHVAPNLEFKGAPSEAVSWPRGVHQLEMKWAPQPLCGKTRQPPWTTVRALYKWSWSLRAIVAAAALSLLKTKLIFSEGNMLKDLVRLIESLCDALWGAYSTWMWMTHIPEIGRSMAKLCQVGLQRVKGVP